LKKALPAVTPAKSGTCGPRVIYPTFVLSPLGDCDIAPPSSNLPLSNSTSIVMEIERMPDQETPTRIACA
jgi:hypothetical protein